MTCQELIGEVPWPDLAVLIGASDRVLSSATALAGAAIRLQSLATLTWGASVSYDDAAAFVLATARRGVAAGDSWP